MSSNWTGTLVWEIGIVPPSAYSCLEVPVWMLTYLRPSSDWAGIEAVESIGTLPLDLLSWSVSCAATWPLGSLIGVIWETSPTRKPPSRTWLPGTRSDPLAMSTLS